MSVSARLADAVVAELESAVLQDVVATRTWRPRAELADLAEIKVFVVPRTLEATRIDRHSVAHQATVDVAIIKRVGAEGDSEIDNLVGLAETIGDHFQGWEASEPAAVCLNVSHDPYVVAEHLEEHHVLTSVVRLTFRVFP